MQLRTARIFVRDLPDASRFYEELLGLPLKSPRSEEGFRVFDAGPMSLVVEHVDADAPAEDQALIGRFTGLSFDVTDVQSKYTELASLGVAFTGLPEQQAWGGILATLRALRATNSSLCSSQGGSTQHGKTAGGQVSPTQENARR